MAADFARPNIITTVLMAAFVVGTATSLIANQPHRQTEFISPLAFFVSLRPESATVRKSPGAATDSVALTGATPPSSTVAARPAVAPKRPAPQPRAPAETKAAKDVARLSGFLEPTPVAQPKPEPAPVAAEQPIEPAAQPAALEQAQFNAAGDQPAAREAGAPVRESEAPETPAAAPLPMPEPAIAETLQANAAEPDVSQSPLATSAAKDDAVQETQPKEGQSQPRRDFFDRVFGFVHLGN